jgi:hypothetical protein
MSHLTIPVLIATPASSIGVARAHEPALLVSIDARANRDGKRLIAWRKDAAFNVIVTNVSDKPIRIWAHWCSWGNDTITFALTDEDGTTTFARSARNTWTINFPDYYELAPQE